MLLRVRADPAGGKKRTVRMPGPVFIERFLQHVLPAGFKRIRHYGLLSPARKKSGLAARARSAGRAATAAGRDRVGGRVSAACRAHRAGALPALRRPGSFVSSPRSAAMPTTPSTGTAVSIQAGVSVVQRSDGGAVRGIARARRRERCLRSRHAANPARPSVAILPILRTRQASARPPTACHSIDFGRAPPYNPHSHRRRGGPVQRGLSAAMTPRSPQPLPLRRINAIR